MAQHNIVHLYGMVHAEPSIIRDDDSLQPISATAYLLTANSSRRYMNNGESNIPEYEQVMITTKDPEVAAQMAQMHLYDIVLLRGTLNTRNVNKRPTCTSCGKKFAINEMRTTNASGSDGEIYSTSMITFVTPIAVDIRAQNLDEDTASRMLMTFRELSNEIQIIGNLCSDPKQWESGRATSYQLGVNRKFYLKHDDPSVYADFPYVRSYGEQAENDFEALHAGSTVLVDGFIKMRTFTRKSTCPYCGTVNTWRDKVLEVVPYSVQYLANYKTGLEREEEKQSMLDEL